MKVDELRVLDRVVADIENPKRFRNFKSLAALEKSEGSLEMAKQYRDVACKANLAKRCNKTAYRDGGLIWTHEARELRRRKRTKAK